MADTPEEVIREVRGKVERDFIAKLKRMRSEIVANTPVRSGFLKSSWEKVDFKRHNFGRSRDFQTKKEYLLHGNDAGYGQYVPRMAKAINNAIKRHFGQ